MFEDEAGYDERVMNVLKYSGGRQPFNVRMPSLPSFRQSTKKYMAQQIKMPKAATVLNIAMIGGIGVVGYLVYSKFIAPMLSKDAVAKDAEDRNVKDGILVNSQHKYSLTQSASSAAKAADAPSLIGLVSSQKHVDIANWFYTCLNVEFSASNQDGIVKQFSLPAGMSDQTFLMVYNAFGIKDFPVNFFSYTEVQKRKGFFDTHWQGSLIDGLKAKMSADNYAKISSRINYLLTLIPT